MLRYVRAAEATPKTFRRVSPLLRSLFMGVIALPIAVAVGGSTTGCRDEDDPITHVEDLKDPVKQRQAMKRLIQFYADAETEDKKDENKPHVKAVLDKIIEPLAQTCLDERVKEQDRSKLVKFMAETRDPRAEPCLKKTLEDYKPDTNEEDVQNVIRAVTAMKMKSLAPQVMKVFRTIEYSRDKAKLLRIDVTKALYALIDKTFEDELLKMIDAPLDPENARQFINDQFWQGTAAGVLGELKSEKAARPLVKMILTPVKGKLGNAAVLALVKIGRPSVKAVEAVLKEEDKELVDFAVAEQMKSVEKDKDGKQNEAQVKAAKRAHIAIAADILGNLGSEASIPPLLAVIDKAGDDIQTKMVVAISLRLLPVTPQTVAAYQKVVDETKLETQFGRGNAKEALLGEPAADFFDPTFVPWILKSAADLKGGKETKDDSEQLDPIRSGAFVAVTKLMKPDQISEVEKLAETKAYRPDEKDDKKKIETKIVEAFKTEFEAAKKLLGDCKEDVKCYLGKGTHEDNQKLENQFIGIKAMYMVGVLGKDEERNQLIDALPKITNGAVRIVALKAIEKLTPKGSAEVADKLQALFDKAEAAKDDKLILEYQPFVQTALRMRARAAQ